MENVLLSVSDFIALTNQTLEMAYPSLNIEGEVASFKVNQGKYVFFDLKDEQGSVGCFMTVWQLRQPIEDGMKVVITASPKLTNWGKFSLTVRDIRPSGQGAIKKSFELLKQKLELEGLFAIERKRQLPRTPKHIGVISSTEAAGYVDFIKIVNERWGGLEIEVAHVQVQGAPAADQIIRAIRYFNGLEQLPEVLVIIRGGGSADDLAVFNDEPLARAIAESRIPTLTGIGHEVDESLADLVADKRAATPSNAAQVLVPDRNEIIRAVQQQTVTIRQRLAMVIDRYTHQVKDNLSDAFDRIEDRLEQTYERLVTLKLMAAQVNPQRVLQQGYALLRGDRAVGGILEVETYDQIINAEVKNVRSK